MAPKLNRIDAHNLGGKVLEWSVEKGMSIRTIRERLIEHYGLTVSTGAIGEYLKSVRDQRAAITQTVLQEYLAKSVTDDLDILTEIIADLRARFATDLQLDARLRVVKELRATVEARLKHSGAADQDKDSVVIAFAGAEPASVEVRRAKPDKHSIEATEDDDEE